MLQCIADAGTGRKTENLPLAINPGIGEALQLLPIARQSDTGVASRRYNLEYDSDRQA
jgi:hypothetical protein